MTAPSATGKILGYAVPFGYYEYSASNDKIRNRMITRINVANFLSYIPLIRIGVGVWRIYTHIFIAMKPDTSSETKKFAYSNIGRGIAEVLLPDSCLILLLAADIGVTIARYLPRLPAST
jgi:hypothetical protein